MTPTCEPKIAKWRMDRLAQCDDETLAQIESKHSARMGISDLDSRKWLEAIRLERARRVGDAS